MAEVGGKAHQITLESMERDLKHVRRFPLMGTIFETRGAKTPLQKQIEKDSERSAAIFQQWRERLLEGRSEIYRETGRVALPAI